MMNETNKIHSDKYFINWHESDFKGVATPAAICNYLGESAGRQAQKLGFGYKDALRLNQFWVVLRWAIKMEKYPKWQDEIIIETWPRMPEHLYAYRDYRIKNMEGRLIGAASSTWMVLDGNTRRPQKLELVEGLLHHTLDKKSLEENARKILPSGKIDAKSPITTKYSDMDFNGHVTNSKYVEWCLDMFDHDFHQKHFLSELQINFLYECRFGDKLELRLSEITKEKFIVTAVNVESEKNIFTAELGWSLQSRKNRNL